MFPLSCKFAGWALKHSYKDVCMCVFVCVRALSWLGPYFTFPPTSHMGVYSFPSASNTLHFSPSPSFLFPSGLFALCDSAFSLLSVCTHAFFLVPFVLVFYLFSLFVLLKYARISVSHPGSQLDSTIQYFKRAETHHKQACDPLWGLNPELWKPR